MSHSKYLAIADELRLRILSSRYQGVLPTARELAKDFGVSSRTLAKARALLVEEGMIAPSPSGTLIQSRLQVVGQKIIAIILPRFSTLTVRLDNDVLLQDMLRKIYDSTYQPLLVEADSGSMGSWLDYLKSGVITGIIFAYGSFTPAFGDVVSGLQIPSVSLNWLPDQCHTSWVDFDAETHVGGIISELVKHNLRHIAFVNTLQDGGRARSYDCLWARYCDRHGIESCIVYKDHLNGLLDFSQPPEAVFSLHRIDLSGIRRLYKDFHLSLKWVYHENLDMPDHWPYLGFDFNKLADISWNMLHKQILARRKTVSVVRIPIRPIILFRTGR